MSLNETNGKENNEAFNIYNLPSTAQAIRFLHAAAGYPTKDTWINAIEAGNYVTWPGLTTKAIRRHFPESDETTKGHTKKQRQNVRSTKNQSQSRQQSATHKREENAGRIH